MTHILSVSMPRSGHHLFESILSNILPDRFKYCEFYETTCCHQIPCVKLNRDASGDNVIMQKSHDFMLTDPIDADNCIRVVQYRSPVARSLSNYELFLNSDGFKKSGRADNVDVFRQYLIAEAVYFVRFYNKWLKDFRSDFFYLNYESLTGDPYKTLKGFLNFAHIDVSEGDFISGIERAMPNRGRDGVSYAYNDIYSHRYAFLQDLADFETVILENCQGYFPIRHLKLGDGSDSYIALNFKARMSLLEGNDETAIQLLERAQSQSTDKKVKSDISKLKRKLGILPKPNLIQRVLEPFIGLTAKA